MYGTRRFITVFKTPATGLYSKPDESRPLLLRSNLKMPHCICEGLPYGLFAGEVLPLKHNVFLVCPVHATWSFSLCSFLQPLSPPPVRSGPEHLSRVFLPHKRASFIPIQNFNLICVNLCCYSRQVDKILKSMVAHIP